MVPSVHVALILASHPNSFVVVTVQFAIRPLQFSRHQRTSMWWKLWQRLKRSLSALSGQESLLLSQNSLFSQSPKSYYMLDIWTITVQPCPPLVMYVYFYTCDTWEQCNNLYNSDFMSVWMEAYLYIWRLAPVGKVWPAWCVVKHQKIRSPLLSIGTTKSMRHRMTKYSQIAQFLHNDSSRCWSEICSCNYKECLWCVEVRIKPWAAISCEVAGLGSRNFVENSRIWQAQRSLGDKSNTLWAGSSCIESLNALFL